MAQLVKNMAGLPIASVSKVNGLAIASAKTIAGLDNTSGGGSLTAGNRATTSSFSGTSGTIASFVNGSVSPLLVHVGTTSGADDCTGVTWNGTAMTRIGTAVLSSGVGRMYLYGLKNAAATTASIVASFSGTVAGMMHCVATVGGDTTTGWRTAYTRTDGDGAGPGLTVVDSVSGDLVFDAISLFGNTITWDAGETTTSSTTNNFGGNGVSGGLSTKPAVGANTVVGATDSVIYGQVAVSVIPA